MYPIKCAKYFLAKLPLQLTNPEKHGRDKLKALSKSTDQKLFRKNRKATKNISIMIAVSIVSNTPSSFIQL